MKKSNGIIAKNYSLSAWSSQRLPHAYPPILFQSDGSKTSKGRIDAGATASWRSTKWLKTFLPCLPDGAPRRNTKSSRKFTKPEWPYPTPQSVREEILAILLILSKETLRSPCVSFACPNLVSIRGVFVSSKAWPRSGAAKARHCAGACPLAQERACRTVAQPPLPKLAFVFRRGAPNPYEKPRF